MTISDNEISFRGEYQPGGPDGCAIDFETNATGVMLARNYISRSFGAGVMVFGHIDGSNTALEILNNTMLYNGCLQSRGDHGGIAFMRKGSSGLIAGNTFATCNGTDLFNDEKDPGTPGWRFQNNAIDGVNANFSIVDTPRVTAEATPDGGLAVTATTETSGAIMRFTTDGSMPASTSQVFPPMGLLFSRSFRATAVFVKAFPAPTTNIGGVLYVESATAGGIFAPN